MISENSQLQHVPDEASCAARAARRAHEEFLDRMSHELRTPLTAVIGFSKVLESNAAGNQRPEDLDMLRRVRAGGEQLLKLVESVLDHSRAGKGNLALEFAGVDVAELTSRVVDAHRTAATAKSLQLIAVLSAMSPMVVVDARRLEQVLDLLIENAVKFTEQGSIRVVLVSDAATGRPTRITISDTGVGIREDHLERIFEPFEQGDNSRRRGHNGAGIGLPLARRLCHAMGCQLMVQSQPGQGSRFTIRFPKDS